MLSSRRMTGKPRNERRGRNSADGLHHIRDMDMNKKMTTPDAAAPMGRWRVLAYGAGFAVYMLARFDLVNLIHDVIERRRLLLLPANPRPEYAPRNAPLRPNDL